MAEDAQELFHAVISATDDATKTLAAIKARLHEVSGEHEHLEHVGSHAFGALGGRISILRGHFGELRASVGETAHSFAEFLPMLAGLGAAGSLAGLVELTAHVAESQAQLAHTATVIGVTTQSLQRLNFAATMTDTPLESVHTAMTKLNKAVGEGAKNKQAASLFQHLGISTRDATGHLKSAADLLPQLSDAFVHTSSAAMRTRMAMTLFGRGGADMMPMLLLGHEKLQEAMAEAGTVGHVSSPEQIKAGIEYADSMKRATAAVQGFKDTLGDSLAPVLKPIVDGMTNWVMINRQWISDDIAGGVRSIGAALKTIDFDSIIKSSTDWLHWMSDLIGSVGGLKTILGATALVMGAEFVAKLRETTIVLKEMTEMLWGPVVEALGAGVKALFATRDAAFALDFALNANPFGVIIMASVAVAAAAYEVWAHWGWLKSQFVGLYAWFEQQPAWVKAVLAAVAPFIAVPLEIMEHWTPLKAFFVGLWDDIKGVFHSALGWMGPIMDRLGRAAMLFGGGAEFAGAGPGDPGGGSGAALPPPVRSPLASPLAAIAGAPGAGGQGGAAGTSGRVAVDVHLHGATPETRVRAATTGAVTTTITRSSGSAWPHPS